jgi:hypothetical protein
LRLAQINVICGQELEMSFISKVLDEYMIGRAMAAIAEIALRGKPIAEVGGVKASQEDVLHDLNCCLEFHLTGNPVFPWALPVEGGRVRFGFYGESWTIEALKFMSVIELSDFHRSWIQGLLFGYRPDVIQKFIDRHGYKPPG